MLLRDDKVSHVRRNVDKLSSTGEQREAESVNQPRWNIIFEYACVRVCFFLRANGAFRGFAPFSENTSQSAPSARYPA